MKVAVIGASGYVGAELIGLLNQHNDVQVSHLLVSENSTSHGCNFDQLHPRWQGIISTPLQSFSAQWLAKHCDSFDAVFLATPHEFSQEIAASLLAKNKTVFDLSGAFRLKEPTLYPKHYQFEHQQPALLKSAVYGLAEWQATEIKAANLIAVPGCYPTASLLSLKPITSKSYQLDDGLVVVNGISGVSGAGRKASLATSFNEVSLTPYNILGHRHQPEISQECAQPVVFNPHLAPYKRGLLATVTLTLNKNVTTQMVDDAYNDAYQHQPMVRIKTQWPKIDDVAHTPFADIHWQYDEQSHVLVVCCAIDNLLKGAASQAIQCLNIKLGVPSSTGLLKGEH